MKENINKISSHILSETSKGTAILGVGNITSALLAIIFTILIARSLGPEKWGSIAVAFGLASITQSIFDFGLASALFRFKADKKKLDFSKLLCLRTITSMIAVFAVLLLLIPLRNFFLPNLNLNLAFWGSLAGVVYLLFDFFVTWEQSKRNYLRSAGYIIANNLLRILIILIFILSSSLTMEKTVIAYLISPLIFVVYFLFVNLSKLKTFSLKYLQKTLKFSLPLGVNRMTGVLSGKIDTLLVFTLLSSYETGIYQAAKQLVFGIPLLIGSLATVIASRFSNYQGKTLRQYFIKTIYLSLLLCIGLILGAAIAPLAIQLFGPQYQQSGWLLRHLILTMIPFVIATPAVNILIYSFGKSNIVAINSAVMLAIVYFGNLYLIPIMGVSAVVLVQWISYMYLMITSFTFALKYLLKK